MESIHLTIDPSARIYVAGHRGLVGSAIVRALQARGHTNLLLRTSRELDLRNQAAVEAFFESARPDYVVLAAAKVGGILAEEMATEDLHPASRDSLVEKVGYQIHPTSRIAEEQRS